LESSGLPGRHLDARLLLILLLAAILMVITSEGFLLPGFFLAGSWLTSFFLGVKTGRFFLRLAEPLFIVSVIFLLHLFFLGTVPLFTLNLGLFSLTASLDGLITGLHLASKVLAACSLVAAVGFYLPFAELLRAFAWFRLPATLLEILVFAYRYLFVLGEDAEVIYQAQKNRLGYSSFRRSLKSLGILGGALIMKAFDESEKLTLALMQRGYDGHLPLPASQPFKARDISITLLVVAFLTLLWWI
jgi:cobalt/nickel transport system permease protein